MAQPIRRSILALPLLFLLALPAAAAENETPSEMAADALAKMIGALEQLIKSIPQYEKPEVTENGDIIIRRKRPNDPPRLPEPGTQDEPGKRRDI